MIAWNTLKRIGLISAAAGAGFALVLAAVAGAVSWYQSRPKSWDKATLKATFDSVTTIGSPNHLLFRFLIENSSDSDYQVNRRDLTIWATLREQKSLSHQDDEDIALTPTPLIIPARQRILLSFELLPYSYHEKVNGIDVRPAAIAFDAPAEERRAFRAKLVNYLHSDLPNLNGFVIYDNEHHYEIDLPKGW